MFIIREIKMRRYSILATVLLVMSWAMADNSQKSGSNAEVEIINGIEYIHNSETPLYPDRTVAFVEDLSIGGEGEEGDIILFEPRLAFVDERDNIYVREFQDQVIKIFNSDGKHICTIGGKGSGPGEFQRMAYLAITKDGQLLVMDSSAKRTSFFDSSGKFLKSFKWKVGYYNFTLMKGSSYIISEIVFSKDRQFQELFVKEIDFDGKVIQNLGQFTAEEPKIIRQDKYTHYVSPPVSHGSIFVGDKNRGIFYHCLNSKYVIEVYDSSGNLFRKISRPYKPVPFTSKDAQEYRAKYDFYPNDVIRKAIRTMEMPKVKSIVSMMLVDDDGNLWIRTNEKKEDKNKILTAFDIFNSSGFYLAKVWTPILPFIFKNEKMYRMDIDSHTGYITIKRYKVIWNF
jgi:hypothetical protein